MTNHGTFPREEPPVLAERVAAKDANLGRIYMRDAERKILDIALRMYPSHAERAAMRGALMDAAGLLDALAKDIASEHTKRGRVTNLGLELTNLVTDCANVVFAMREKIEMPDA